MKTSTDLITFINAVRADFPYADLKLADQHLQTQLKETASNDVFKTFEGSSQHPAIESAELRARFDKKNGPQLLILHLREPLEADLAAIEKSLGVKGQDMGATTPHAHKPETYTKYRLSSSELRLTLDLKKRVTQIVFDGFAR